MASSMFIAKAQNDTSRVRFSVTPQQLQTILNGLGELKLKDGMSTYMSLLNQSQEQLSNLVQKQSAIVPDSTKKVKSEPTKK